MSKKYTVSFNYRVDAFDTAETPEDYDNAVARRGLIIAIAAGVHPDNVEMFDKGNGDHLCLVNVADFMAGYTVYGRLREAGYAVTQ